MNTPTTAAVAAPGIHYRNPIERDMANALRALAMDAVQAANSGHPGMPMGMAEIAVALWRGHLRHNPGNPHWANRDRFVLSNGHGSMLLYGLLHLTGYDLPIDELRRFRQLGSKTPGHPEYGLTSGVEATTGPLGQGVANMGVSLVGGIPGGGSISGTARYLNHRGGMIVWDRTDETITPLVMNVIHESQPIGAPQEDRLDTPIGTLSGGQRQALTLLMATWQKPRLLLLDEHTAALDPKSAEQVVALSEQVITRDRLTTLMVTHSMQQAATLGDRLLMMHHGKVLLSLDGAQKKRVRPEELLARFEDVRRSDLLDESAAEMLARCYI